MRKLMVSGKPSSFVAAGQIPEEQPAQFVLTERAFVDGQALEVIWLIEVPVYKTKYVQGLCERGYAIMVEGEKFKTYTKKQKEDNGFDAILAMKEAYSL